MVSSTSESPREALGHRHHRTISSFVAYRRTRSLTILIIMLSGPSFNPIRCYMSLLFHKPADSVSRAVDLGRVAFPSLDTSIPIRGETQLGTPGMQDLRICLVEVRTSWVSTTVGHGSGTEKSNAGQATKVIILRPLELISTVIRKHPTSAARPGFETGAPVTGRARFGAASCS